jgi:hypothetical protein
VEFGRHTSLRTRRLLHGSSSLPRPTSYAPVAESADAARSRRVPTCRFDSCREYHAPDRTVTVAASKTAIRGSIPRGCAMWEMPKWSRRRSAKPLLPGSSPGSHSNRRARSDGNAFWSRKPALWERPGWRFDSSALRHYLVVTLNILLFTIASLSM